MFFLFACLFVLQVIEKKDEKKSVLTANKHRQTTTKTFPEMWRVCAINTCKSVIILCKSVVVLFFFAGTTAKPQLQRTRVAAPNLS